MNVTLTQAFSVLQGYMFQSSQFLFKTVLFYFSVDTVPYYLISGINNHYLTADKNIKWFDLMIWILCYVNPLD